MLIKRCLILSVILLLLVNWTHADLEIKVLESEGWGPASVSNIQKLCENVASHFQEHLREEHKVKNKKLIVDHGGVYVEYRDSVPNTHFVFLSVTDKYWQQFAYQFSHEFTHVMHRHEITTRNNPNLWFQESIAMMASIWALREMEKSWEYNAPYDNWAGWRHNLGKYADQNMNGWKYSGTASEWLDDNEQFLRNEHAKGKPFTYHKLVAELSCEFLLPIFEKHPEAWNAVTQLPDNSKGKLDSYIQDWYDKVNIQDKELVESMAEALNISIRKQLPVITLTNVNADINEDGYIDIHDILIVRAGMTSPVMYDTDLNNDGVTDEADLLIVKMAAMQAIIAASPKKRKIKLTTWGNIKRR